MKNLVPYTSSKNKPLIVQITLDEVIHCVDGLTRHYCEGLDYRKQRWSWLYDVGEVHTNTGLIFEVKTPTYNYWKF